MNFKKDPEWMIQTAGSEFFENPMGKYQVSSMGKSVQIGGPESKQEADVLSIQIGGHDAEQIANHCTYQSALWDSMQKQGGYALQKSGWNAVQIADYHSVQITEDNSEQNAGYCAVQIGRSNTTQCAGDRSVQIIHGDISYIVKNGKECVFIQYYATGKAILDLDEELKNFEIGDKIKIEKGKVIGKV